MGGGGPRLVMPLGHDRLLAGRTFAIGAHVGRWAELDGIADAFEQSPGQPTFSFNNPASHSWTGRRTAWPRRSRRGRRSRPREPDPGRDPRGPDGRGTGLDRQRRCVRAPTVHPFGDAVKRREDLATSTVCRMGRTSNVQTLISPTSCARTVRVRHRQAELEAIGLRHRSQTVCLGWQCPLLRASPSQSLDESPTQYLTLITRDISSSTKGPTS